MVYKAVSSQLSEIWRQKGQNIEGEQTSDYSGTPEGISLSNDGNRFIIGAAGNDGDSVNGSDRGHSRIFEWNGTIWQQIGQEIIDILHICIQTIPL